VTRMAKKSIGPSFADELAAHGDLIGQHFTWSPDGTIEFFEDTPQSVIDGVNAVYKAHDPRKPSWGHMQLQARDALTASDVTVTRCAENSVKVPKEWADYRKSLRLILSSKSGDAIKGLPAAPPYPEGT